MGLISRLIDKLTSWYSKRKLNQDMVSLLEKYPQDFPRIISTLKATSFYDSTNNNFAVNDPNNFNNYIDIEYTIGTKRYKLTEDAFKDLLAEYFYTMTKISSLEDPKNLNSARDYGLDSVVFGTTFSILGGIFGSMLLFPIGVFLTAFGSGLLSYYIWGWNWKRRKEKVKKAYRDYREDVKLWIKLLKNSLENGTNEFKNWAKDILRRYWKKVRGVDPGDGDYLRIINELENILGGL